METIITDFLQERIESMMYMIVNYGMTSETKERLNKTIYQLQKRMQLTDEEMDAFVRASITVEIMTGKLDAYADFGMTTFDVINELYKNYKC